MVLLFCGGFFVGGVFFVVFWWFFHSYYTVTSQLTTGLEQIEPFLKVGGVMAGSGLFLYYF
jgi:hypothetical protein